MPAKKSVWTRIVKIVTAVTVFCGLIGGAIGYDKSKADTTDLESVKEVFESRLVRVSNKLEYKITSDQAYQLQQRVWDMEDRFRERPMTPQVLDEFRLLRQDLEDAKTSRDLLRKQEM